MDRATAGVSEAGTDRLLGVGGPLVSLARARRDPGAGCLWRELGEELGADGVAWIGDGGEHHAWPRPEPRTIEWRLVDSLAPGEVRMVREEDLARSPRLAASDARRLYIRTGDSAPAPGVLAVASHGTIPLGRAAWVALAELAGIAARDLEDPRARSKAHRERELGRRAGGVLHDLRNQLAVAILQVDRASEEADYEVGGLKGVLRSARELCVGALEGEALAHQGVPLRALLLEEARVATSAARSGLGVRVRVRCEEGVLVAGDRSRVKRLVHNLTLNAVEACADGATVSLEGLRLPEGGVRLIVEDEGRGMNEVELRRLLSPERISSRGTGLGGASLFHCMSDLGATVLVESAPRRGTRFQIDLAAFEEAGTDTILLVDPDPRRRRVTAERLAERDFAPLGVPSAQAALSVLARGGVARILVQRGTAGAGLSALIDRAKREEIPLGPV